MRLWRRRRSKVDVLYSELLRTQRKVYGIEQDIKELKEAANRDRNPLDMGNQSGVSRETEQEG